MPCPGSIGQIRIHPDSHQMTFTIGCGNVSIVNKADAFADCFIFCRNELMLKFVIFHKSRPCMTNEYMDGNAILQTNNSVLHMYDTGKRLNRAGMAGSLILSGF